MALFTKEEALAYHSDKRKGKLEVISIKPCETQKHLSMAYSPGVAEACRAIHADKEKVYEYTNKGNLVAVVSNGTAVL
ncbi:MAG: malate dehydrogenase, partial [Proteobacteria bacterium]|nr:malate dehydrogenase [Pseudomonadota bacterium]